MSIGQTKRIRRGIMGALLPLTGTRSSGTATVRATGGDIVLPRGSFALPVTTSAAGVSQLAEDLPLWVTVDTTVTAAGAAVPVSSLLGGARQNMPTASRVRWDPALAGVEIESVLASALTGGADASGPGSVRQVRQYETLEADTGRDLFAACVGQAPAIVLAWERSGGEVGRGGGRSLRPDQWLLYVVTSNARGAVARGDEGSEILDGIEDYLTDRSAADGIPFSGPPTKVLERVRVRVTQTAFIYAVRIQTFASVVRTDTRTSYAVWLRNRLDAKTADPTPLPVVDGAIWPQV